MDNLQPGTAPKVTPADIEAEIASEHYFTADQGVFGAAMDLDGTAERCQFPALALLTICVITMRNGFTVTGESACASPENFDAEVGRKVARAAAISKCWALLGYQLRTQLSNQAQQPVPESAADAYRQRVWAEDDRISAMHKRPSAAPEPVVVEFNIIDNPADFGYLVVALGRRGDVEHEEREAVERAKPSNTEDDRRRFVTEAKQRAAARVEKWFASRA